MGRFQKHEPCPSCGSRDNLGVWDDGKWCFGCGYRERAETTVAAVERLRERKTPVDNVGISLPPDAINTLPTVVKMWLSKFDITWAVQLQHDMMWSEERKLLIFPLWDAPVSSRRLIQQVGEVKEDGLIAWQGRYFGPDTKHPKYTSEGKLVDVIDLIGDIDSDSVFVVEDKVSAMKLGMLECAMPLWGTHVGDKRANYLSHRFHNLYIWLDPDKKKEALKQAIKYSPMFNHVGVVYSSKDPKEHTYKEIREIINDQVKAEPNPIDRGD
jgi:Zn ribbon nucleic-acid-binding protein